MHSHAKAHLDIFFQLFFKDYSLSCLFREVYIIYIYIFLNLHAPCSMIVYAIIELVLPEVIPFCNS